MPSDNNERESTQTFDEILARMMELKLNGSRSGAKKCMQEFTKQRNDSGQGCPQKCLSCDQYFDSRPEWLKHVRAKKHIKPRDEIKGQRQEFIDDRLANDNIKTVAQAQNMYDNDIPRKMSGAEKATWRNYQIQLAWMKRL